MIDRRTARSQSDGLSQSAIISQTSGCKVRIKRRTGSAGKITRAPAATGGIADEIMSAARERAPRDCYVRPGILGDNAVGWMKCRGRVNAAVIAGDRATSHG